MRVLILGGDGMLGSRLFRHFRAEHDVHATLRRERAAYAGLPGAPPADAATFGVDVRQIEAVARVIGAFRPDAVVNAVGVVKQRPDVKDAAGTVEINALFPHRLLAACLDAGARLVHFSTDCVFSGRRGGYAETDTPDAEDLYGRSKLLGEVSAPPAITLRSSIVGLELARRQGLVEWFLGQRGTIKGYRKAIFSGLTTAEMARLVERLLTRHRDLSGVWHVAAAPIDKYTLLTQLGARLGRTDVTLEPDDVFACDRSLDGAAFRTATGWEAPAWSAMLDDLAGEVRQREKE
jgi:dTDP-4-dehydrorhamnose reductase